MLRDYLNFLSKISFSRAVNALYLTYSYILSRFFDKSYNPAMPVAVAIEPTTACNLRCPECPSGLRSFTRATGKLDILLFEKIIEELKSTLMYLTFYFQGEPYLHKDFLKMVNFASTKRIYTSTSTNAHYLNKATSFETVKSGLDRLIISIDGTTQETYQQYRVGGDLKKVLEGTKNIIAAKKELKSNTPHIIFQYLVVKPNEHQIEEAKQLAKEMGVDEIRFKTAQIYDYEDGNDLIPENTKYSRYEETTVGKYRIKNKLIDNCWKMWHSCVITWDGLVVPCCFDKDAEHQLGDLKKFTFRQIWNNEVYLNFRESLISSRKKVEMCKNCTEGTKIWG